MRTFGKEAHRELLGAERAAVESLRSQVEKAQQAVRDEQLLAERLRQQASVASASAQRRARTAASATVSWWTSCSCAVRVSPRAVTCPQPCAVQEAVCAEAGDSSRGAPADGGQGCCKSVACVTQSGSPAACLSGSSCLSVCAAGPGEGGEGGSGARAPADGARARGGALARSGALLRSPGISVLCIVSSDGVGRPVL